MSTGHRWLIACFLHRASQFLLSSNSFQHVKYQITTPQSVHNVPIHHRTGQTSECVGAAHGSNISKKRQTWLAIINLAAATIIVINMSVMVDISWYEEQSFPFWATRQTIINDHNGPFESDTTFYWTQHTKFSLLFLVHDNIASSLVIFLNLVPDKRWSKSCTYLFLGCKRCSSTSIIHHCQWYL